MSIQLQIEEMPGYLAARFTGVGVAEEVWSQFELIAGHCKSANKNNFFSMSLKPTWNHLLRINSS